MSEGSPAGFAHSSLFDFASAKDLAVYEEAWRELDETMRDLKVTGLRIRLPKRPRLGGLCALSRSLRSAQPIVPVHLLEGTLA